MFYWDKIKTSLTSKLPILNYLVKYDKKDVASDIVAGVTVGMMLIPQSIAYASLAGLEPQFGLYSAIAGGFMYAFFGTIRQITIGPTAILSLLTLHYAKEDAKVAALLSFLSGCCEFLFGAAKLGFVIDFISMPVISGYTSAASLVIASSQIKGLLGLKFKSNTFLSTILKLFQNVKDTIWQDALLGFSCLSILFFMRHIKDWPYFKESKVFFYVSSGKNALIVVLSTLLAYMLDSYGLRPFQLTGNITKGLPSFLLPSISIEDDDDDSDFPDVVKKLGFGITTITCIAIISHIVVAKVFTKGKTMNASQEMVALGLANIAGSFIGSMPVSASFSRSAVNNSCGVRTPLSGICTALLVILALAILTPYFYFIPKATLSAVIMSAVVFMFDFGVTIPMWKTNKKDLIPMYGTFFSALLLGIEIGLVTGLVIDLVILLYYSSRPNISVEKIDINGMSYWILTPKSGILYPAANHFHQNIVLEACKVDQANAKKIILNLNHIAFMDYTSMQALKCIVTDLTISGRDCVIVNLRKNLLSGVRELLPKIEYFESLECMRNPVYRV